jgi:hypothetical protein
MNKWLRARPAQQSTIAELQARIEELRPTVMMLA